MAELLSLELVKDNLVTNQIVLDIGYDIDNLIIPGISESYTGEITTDRYGRKVPKNAHGTINIDHNTSSTKIIIENTINLYERIIDKKLLVRRINITANNLIDELEVKKDYEQIDLFTNYEEIKKKRKKEEDEKRIQKAMLNIKDKYGKNAILKGMNLQEEGTTLERNKQIGGHQE